MIANSEITTSVNDLTNSHAQLTASTKRYTWREKSKNSLKYVRAVIREITVEPCLFTYMFCTAISALTVQNMHLEKACRVNFNYSDAICDRIRDRDTTGLEDELINIQSLVAGVAAWKLPLQTAIPAVMAIFVGAWSDKYKKRKICILFPFVGEIIVNIGLLFATYYFKELPLAATALIEALPAACTGSFIIIFMGMYSFMADRTTLENRTFRLGLVSVCVTLGAPAGTALSGILIRFLGYYGVFTLLLLLHTFSFTYGLFKLEDVMVNDEVKSEGDDVRNRCSKILHEVLQLVANTFLVALRPRAMRGRMQIFCLLILHFLFVGPLYGDSQVAYLYMIRKFNFTEVEYSIYGTFTIVLNLFGSLFCIALLSKRLKIQDSAIGCLSGLSRIAACFMYAFAPTRQWFYCAPLFSIFSGTGLTMIRSLVTKSVPSEEVAKLNSLIGLAESIAPSVYMPITSYIYVSSIDSFPGAFFMFDASLTVLALILFGLIYVLVKRRQDTVVTNPQIKEEYARTNEASRF